jgi:hypothetical protein
VPFPQARDEAPVGRDPRALEIELRQAEQHPSLAGGHVDHDQLAVRLARGVPLPPAGNDRGAVRCQLERLVVQRPSRLGREVAEPGGFPGPFGPIIFVVHFGVVGHLGFLVPAGPPDVRLRHLAGIDREQPRLVGPQVVIPEPDRRGLVQDSGDPGVCALLAQLSVVAVARGGQDRRADDDAAGVPGHLGGHHAAGRRGHHPRLAAGRGEQPQRGDLTGIAVLGLDGVGPPGGEQQRPVGQEARGALALGGPGQPPGRAALRVDPPDAGQVLLLVGAQRLHRRGQPGPVGRQPQRRHPRHRHEVPQVIKGGPVAFGGGSALTGAPS